MRIDIVDDTKQIETIVDANSGEILTTKTNTSKRIILREDANFFFMFEYIKGVYKHLTGVQLKLLIWFVFEVSINEVKVVINKNRLDELALELDSTYNTLKIGLSKLVELGILVRVGRGTYSLNPVYAWKGSLYKRSNKIIELVRADTIALPKSTL